MVVLLQMIQRFCEQNQAQPLEALVVRMDLHKLQQWLVGLFFPSIACFMVDFTSVS
jgi:hypothetical protein